MKKLLAGIIGGLLMAVALIPTPDDVSVVSPLVQFAVGLSLLGYALGFDVPVLHSSSGRKLHRSKRPIKYHGRSGHPVIHETETGRRFIMVRKKGGGTRRLYEGTRYRANAKGESPDYRVLRLR